MCQEITTLKGYVDAHPKACPDLNKVLKTVTPLMEMDTIAMIRSDLGQPYKDYTVWRRNPTHCGLWIHYAHTIFHREAIAYAAIPDAVMYTTQLYHALNEENLLSDRWEDLDRLRGMHGNSTFFVGEPPKDFEGHWRNYCMSLGMSLANWASGKRNKNIKETKAARRQTKFKGPVSSWIASRIATKGDERLISTQAIEDAIEEGERTHAADFVELISRE